ncbi:PAS domain S-box protein [Paraburkholderia sp. CNPSo 3076]|uniref:PAS domain S-box protein n=1 Tax=Paraburkholderia sp. CNPSo 3076 TaxID=2940936 RepID=UPI002256D80B|nr:PAS domain S-box protein [Paraburkholderia sp. CNPSo 3076]MCX5543757.1 PAS domain S-box protein [Paraburkholderia sp. CNPSo 3076]
MRISSGNGQKRSARQYGRRLEKLALVARPKGRTVMEYELSRTVDALPGLVWTALSDGRIEFVNRPWCEYTGLSVEHACDEGWQSAFHPEDRSALLEAWQVVVASGVRGEAEARMRRFDGIYRWFLCRVSPVIDDAGNVVKWCGINTDIEDRKQAEASMRAHEERFRLIVDRLPTRVILFTAEGEVLQANRHTLKYSGATVDDLKQWTVKDFIHPDDQRATVSRFYASIRSGEPYDFESRHRRADGVYQWFRVQGFPLQDKEGRIALWYFLQTDIDDRKRAEALLAGEKRLLEMVAVGLPLPTVLDDLCGLVEQIASDCLCSIALIEPGDMTFQRVNAPGLALTYTYPSSGGRVQQDQGPCGLAASLSEQIVVSDIASESRWPKAWRDSSLAHGLRACWATPILSRTNEVLGTFTIFRSEPGTPTPFQFDLTGRLTQLASIAIERARSERALKRSEERFRAIVDTTPDCVTVVANDGTVLLVNPAGSRAFGSVRADSMIGACYFDFVAPEHRARYVEFNRNICSGRGDFLEFDFISPNNKRRHLETHAAPMHDSDGAIVQLGVTRDITARKQAEAQLRKSAALMAKVEQLTLSGSFSWRPETGSFTWSAQLYRIFGFEQGVRVTLDMIAARVHPGDLHLLHEMIERAKDGQHLEFEHRLLLSDGSVRHVRIQAHATRNPQGRLDYIGAIHDVTERRESEEALYGLRVELAHASRVNSLGALTASIAHEINQPLAGIMTNASTGLRMLSAQPPNVEGALGTVKRTIRDGHRASEMMRRLRALYSKKMVTKDAVDLVEAANDVIELLLAEIRNKRIVLRLETADNLPPVTGDRVQLQQVVLNLLLNAMEAMNGIAERPRQMVVKIERDDGDRLRLAVTDSGMGIDPQHAGRLFDAFFTTKREGMGIGLSVSRCIIERHGGRLWASSNEGFGATFSFSIPCRAERMAAADGSVGKSPQPRSDIAQIVSDQ